MSPGTLTRTFLEKRELDWVPRELRRVRWLAIPAGAAPVAAAAGGVLAAIPVAEALTLLLGAGMYLALGGICVGYLADRRVLRPILRRRVRRLAGGQHDLRALRSSKDGELVHVRGTVRPGVTLPSVLEPGHAGVYRRVRQNVDGTCVLHEDARDFWLEDGSGEKIRVEIAESRLVVPGPELPWRVVDRATYLALLDRVSEAVLPMGKVLAQSRTKMLHVGELIVDEGSTVDVIGWKSRVPDFTIEERLARETPMRTILRGGGTLPLLVSPAAV